MRSVSNSEELVNVTFTTTEPLPGIVTLKGEMITVAFNVLRLGGKLSG